MAVLRGRAQDAALRDTSRCAAYYGMHPQAPSIPWVAVPHPLGVAITAGAPLTEATKLPADLRKDFAFADWGENTITLIPLAETSNPKQTVLARSASGPVRLRVGRTPLLRCRQPGQLRRIASG